MPGSRTGDDRGVGRASGDDDVGAPVKRFDNPPGAQIDVRGDVVDRGDRFARLEVEDVDAGLPQLAESGQQVVAVDVGDGRVEAQRVSHLRDGFCAVIGIEASGVRHHLDALIEAGAHDLLHLRHEGAGVARSGPLRLCAGEDQHRELGKPVAGERVDRPALDHLLGGRESVAVEARAVGDTDRVSHRQAPRS